MKITVSTVCAMVSFTCSVICLTAAGISGDHSDAMSCLCWMLATINWGFHSTEKP